MKFATHTEGERSHQLQIKYAISTDLQAKNLDMERTRRQSSS
jgi:hypothetical protein